MNTGYQEMISKSLSPAWIIIFYDGKGAVMRIFFGAGALLIGVLLLVSAGTADQVSSTSTQSGTVWNGTWESIGYTLFIQQNQSAIGGEYEPLNISELDPGLFEGAVSADGMVFSGTWTESGRNELVLADDQMSYTGTGSVRPEGSLTGPGSYAVTGNRVESSFDPVERWNGTWKTNLTISTFIQNGTHVTGSYEPLSGLNDEPGLFDGNVSPDGKTLTGTWLESGNFSFHVSENGLFWNGTYDIARYPSAGSDVWNATKLG